jgi:DNA-binding NarL/FixJ family response regulator
MKFMLSEVTILLADDHPIVRQGLRQAIEREKDFKIVAEAADGRTALERIQALAPQIAILDVDMPKLDGFGVLRELARQRSPAKVIFLTIHSEQEFFHQAIDLGALGYVLKDSAVTDIVNSIRAVALGHHYTSPAMTTFLMARRKGALALARQMPGIESLTATERRILLLIAEYKTSTEIAKDLFISPRTVETHRTNICNKLDLHGKHALMKFALSHRDDLA